MGKIQILICTIYTQICIFYRLKCEILILDLSVGNEKLKKCFNVKRDTNTPLCGCSLF